MESLAYDHWFKSVIDAWTDVDTGVKEKVVNELIGLLEKYETPREGLIEARDELEAMKAIATFGENAPSRIKKTIQSWFNQPQIQLEYVDVLLDTIYQWQGTISVDHYTREVEDVLNEHHDFILKPSLEVKRIITKWRHSK